MNRLIDLDLRHAKVWLSCPWDPQTVGTIKTIPGREYDNRSRRWSVPLAQVAIVIERLQPLHFRFTPRMREWWAEHRDALPEPQVVEPVVEVDPADGYSVSRLNEEARQALMGHFGEVWVVAEIDGFDRNKPGGHAYFELLERTAAGGEAIARVRAVIFASARQRIDADLPDDLAMRDGLRMRLRGRVELYAPTGSYQVVVDAIDVEWAIGARRRKRDEVLERLRTEGIAAHNRNLQMPIVPLRVGLITAAGSDAYNDFVHELERSELGFEVSFHTARMQGREAEGSVVAALGWFAQHADAFDVVVVTRGGGSKQDLSTFDSLAIGRAVCLLPIKVIAGIGHHRDQSVLDAVAASEKTPTAAAQAIVGHVQRALARVDDAAQRVRRQARHALDRSTQRVDRAASMCERTTTRRLSAARRAVDRAAAGCDRSARGRLADARRRVDRAGVRLAERGVAPIAHAGDRVERAAQKIERASERAIANQRLQIDHIAAKLRLADPRRVVERGYALLRDQDGRVITDAAALVRLDHARVELRDGVVRVTPQEMIDE